MPGWPVIAPPSAALQAKLDNVAEGMKPADAETVETMRAQVARLGRLVDRLLELSRLEGGAEAFERRRSTSGGCSSRPRARARLRRIVALHGGEIRVEDAEPHGCRMVVELPAG